LLGYPSKMRRFLCLWFTLSAIVQCQSQDQVPVQRLDGTAIREDPSIGEAHDVAFAQPDAITDNDGNEIAQADTAGFPEIAIAYDPHLGKVVVGIVAPEGGTAADVKIEFHPGLSRGDRPTSVGIAQEVRVNPDNAATGIVEIVDDGSIPAHFQVADYAALDTDKATYAVALRVYYPPLGQWYWYWYYWTPWWRCHWFYPWWNWFCSCFCWRPVWWYWNGIYYYWYNNWYFPYWWRCPWWSPNWWPWYGHYCYYWPRCYWWWPWW